MIVVTFLIVYCLYVAVYDCTVTFLIVYSFSFGSCCSIHEPVLTAYTVYTL